MKLVGMHPGVAWYLFRTDKKFADALLCAAPPLVQKLIDDNWETIADDATTWAYDPELLQLEAKQSPAEVSDGVAAIEELLDSPPAAGTLYQIVTHEGNRMLAEETDAAAAAWLRGLTRQLRIWLGEYAPPKRQA
ncbi:MAG TPA: hypothetical protein VHW23_15545 [Kofleriaceae bacterium]|jgi:hypothetical protein|nr:hypothetical protein [Kofleriaceae bacterium]